jgi:hypothetical protein
MNLGKVRKAVAKYVGDSGACETDPVVVEAINEARRIIYPLGDWDCITEPICVKPYDHAITLPHDLDYAKKGYACTGRITIANDWFSRVVGDFDGYCGGCINPMRRIPGLHATFREWPCIRRQSECCPEHGFFIKLVFESDNDCDTTITFNGYGPTRRKLSVTRTFNGKAWKPFIAQPGELPFLKIENVIKPRTDGRIRVYGYDGANELLLALYEPEDVDPSYTRYCVTTCGPVLLKAKKKFIDLTDDTDFVEINTDAIIHALQALTDRKARNDTGFGTKLSLARDLLDKENAGPQTTATAPIRMSSAYRVEGLVGYDY